MCDFFLFEELTFSLNTSVCILCALLARPRKGPKEIFVGVSQKKLRGVRGSTFFLGGWGGLLNKISPQHQEEGVWGEGKTTCFNNLRINGPSLFFANYAIPDQY